MKTITMKLIAAAAVSALLAGAATAQTQQDTKSGGQTSPMNKSGDQPKAGAGGTATQAPAATQDAEKKAQEGAKDNSMAPNKGGMATKSDTPASATQDAEKKSQQGNQPK